MQRSHVMIQLVGTIGLAALLVLTGCAAAGSAGRGSAQGSEVRELRVLTSPAPVVIGEGTQPNGVWTQVYALGSGGSRGIELPPGTLELLLFDGQIRRDDEDPSEPYVHIRHRSDAIASAASRAVAGVRYTLPVRWGDRRPDSGVMTLVVRFTPDGGEPVSSSAVSVRLNPA